MKSLFFLTTFFISFNGFSQNIDWFAAADFVGVNNNTESYEQDIYLREFELALHSKVDQDWSAALSLVYAKAANSEEMQTELHEVYLQSSSIFSGDTIKIGQFFLGTGKLNRVHRHEWVFTSTPFFFEKYFGEEGVIDSGVEYTLRIGTSQNLQLTAGVTRGGEFVHEHSHHEEEDEEELSNAQWPTHYIRLGGFKEFSTLKGLEYGLNYIVRKDAEKTAWYYSGIDFTYKAREGKFLSFLVQSEFWSRTYKSNGEDELTDSGYYLFMEKGLDQHHSVGFGVTGFTPSDDHSEEEHEEEGRSVHEEYTSLNLNYTYSNSEFIKYRFSVEQENGLEIDGNEDATNYKYQVQMLFNIGKHPVHLF
ncbi:MAG: hypothetical protein ACJAS4_001994 [Bacteriovoracaceae bacterium]|jgi:hypothetical protein